MSTHTDPSVPTPRLRISARKAAFAAAAILTTAGIWASADGSAQAEPTNQPGTSNRDLMVSVARYADAHGLSGLSPASLSPSGACRGLSLASATDCSGSELQRLSCVDARLEEDACSDERP